MDCRTACSRDVDVDSVRRKLEAFKMWMWRMEKNQHAGKSYQWGSSWTIKWRQANTEFYLAKEALRDMEAFYVNLLKAEW